MIRRAVHDPAVIEAWRRIAEPRRKRSRVLLAGCAWGAVALTVCAIVFRQPLWMLGVWLLFAIALLGSKWGAWRLRCPHCGKVPVGSIARNNPEFAEICSHCNHWLRWGLPDPQPGASQD